MESKVKLGINNKVAKFVLNDPEKYNPLNQEKKDVIKKKLIISLPQCH